MKNNSTQKGGIYKLSAIQDIGVAMEAGKRKVAQHPIGAAIGNGIKPVNLLQGMVNTTGPLARSPNWARSLYPKCSLRPGP